jgi:hypothetical protein
MQNQCQFSSRRRDPLAAGRTVTAFLQRTYHTHKKPQHDPNTLSVTLTKLRTAPFLASHKHTHATMRVGLRFPWAVSPPAPPSPR